MKFTDIAVIIPALDEEGSIAAVIASIPAGVRVIVADNGSTDATAQRAVQAGATVIAVPERGYGNAIQAGIRHLRSAPPVAVVILDADLADDPSRIPDLVGPILSDEADFVLADRTADAEPGALTTAQRIGNLIAVAGIARATGHRYRDLGPFRALRFTSLLELDLVDPTWGWNVEMQLKAVRHGLRIRELPMPYRCRHSGQSKISGTVMGTVRAGYRILLTLARHNAL